jgi:ketosteroid isomerase-like protein
MNRTPASLRFTFVALLAVFPAGCSDSGPAAPGSEATDFTEPAALVAAQAAAIASMDAERYTALLEAPDGQGNGGFRYYPSPSALASLSWLPGDSWSYPEETSMMANLLDPAYVSDVLGTSVQRMEFSLQVLQVTSGAGGTSVVNAVMAARATMTQGPAIALQQPVTLELVRDADGYCRIHSIREVTPTRVATGTWTQLMVAFRDGPATPTEVVLAHASALTRRDFDAYAALLHPDFEYVPQSMDITDLPWLTPDQPWDRAEELGMIAHMFDPDFQGQGWVQAVDSIDARLTVLDETSGEEGTEVVATADIIVLWSANSGAFAAVRLVFTIAPNEHGHLRILRIEELPDHSREVVEETSWASVKALYR